MNKKGILAVFYIVLMLFGAVFLIFSIPIAKVDDEKNSTSNTNVSPRPATIPFDYYRDIEIGKDYIYNVTGFGVNSVWTNFSGGKSDWKTDINEQIYINFTGFFDRDPNDPGDTFPDIEMPWINISIFESGHLLNYTNVNASNSEVSRNLKLGIADFQPGFLITVNHTDWIKANATLEANSESADLTIEETHNFLLFKFEQIGGQNQTLLIYDKITGLLVRANITIDTFHLEIFLESYALSFEREYTYDVKTFGPPGWAIWVDLWGGFVDIYATNEGGQITLNFTGLYDPDPLVWAPGDPFKYAKGRAWLDIKVIYKGVVRNDITMELHNVSNSECASSLIISLPGFLTGFLIPMINNKSFDFETEAIAATSFTKDRKFTYQETDLTIIMDFECGGAFPQDTMLIYEKFTGLLMYTDTKGSNYHLEMEIENYDLPEESIQVLIDDDDDDDDKKKKGQIIPSFPLIMIFGIISTISLIMILRMKKNIKGNLNV